MITDYTDGKVMMTSWRWNTAAVTPGNSAGVCVAEPQPSDSYWSCWEFQMREDGEYNDPPKSYLIDPNTFQSASSLSQFSDLTVEQFPALYGAWLCFPAMTLQETTFTNCLRFLPDDQYSKKEDYGFKAGEQVDVMTYLTSRNSTNTTEVNGNENLMSDGLQVFEKFTVDLMGAWSGISVAGLALASMCATLIF